MPVPVPASPTLHCILISNSHTLLDASLFPSHIPTNRAFAPCEPKETDSFPLPLYTLRTNPAGKQTFISGADRGPFAAVNWSSASASHSQSPCENANGNSLSFFKSAMTSDTGVSTDPLVVIDGLQVRSTELLVGSHGLHGFSKKFRVPGYKDPFKWKKASACIWQCYAPDRSLITTLEINKKIRLIMYAPPSPSSAPASSSSTTSTSTSGGYSTWNPPPFPSIAYRTLLDTIVLTGLLMTVGTEDIVGFCSSTPSPSVLPESGARRTLGSSAAGSTRSPRAHSSSAPEPSCAVTTSGSGSGSRSMKAPWAHWVVPGNGDGMSGSTRNLIGRRSRSSRGDNSATSSQTSTETSKSSMSKMSKVSSFTGVSVRSMKSAPSLRGAALSQTEDAVEEGKERKKEDGKRKHSAGILKSMLPMISAFALGPGGGPFGSSITTTPSSSVPDFEEEKASDSGSRASTRRHAFDYQRCGSVGVSGGQARMRTLSASMLVSSPKPVSTGWSSHLMEPIPASPVGTRFDSLHTARPTMTSSSRSSGEMTDASLESMKFAENPNLHHLRPLPPQTRSFLFPSMSSSASQFSSTSGFTTPVRTSSYAMAPPTTPDRPSSKHSFLRLNSSPASVRSPSRSAMLAPPVSLPRTPTPPRSTGPCGLPPTPTTPLSMASSSMDPSEEGYYGPSSPLPILSEAKSCSKGSTMESGGESVSGGGTGKLSWRKRKISRSAIKGLGSAVKSPGTSSSLGGTVKETTVVNGVSGGTSGREVEEVVGQEGCLMGLLGAA